MRRVAAFLFLACLGVCSFAQSLFEPQGLETFDGKTWSGLTIGQSTDGEIKKSWRTEKGAIRPEALVISQPDGSPRIEALLAGRGSRAKLSGIRVTFPGGGPAPEFINRTFGTAPLVRYQSGRVEDWWVLAYPDRGVIFFVEGPEERARVRHAILADPERVQQALSLWSPEPTEVEPYIDPYEDQPRLALFGYTSVNFSLSGVRVEDQARERQDLEGALRGLRAGGTIRYRSGANGTMDLRISGNARSGRDGTLSVTANFRGATHYGEVRVEVSDSQTIPRRRDGGEPTLRYFSLVYDLLRELEDQVQRRIMAQGPPPIESRRLASWAGLMNAVAPPTN